MNDLHDIVISPDPFIKDNKNIFLVVFFLPVPDSLIMLAVHDSVRDFGTTKIEKPPTKKSATIEIADIVDAAMTDFLEMLMGCS